MVIWVDRVLNALVTIGIFAALLGLAIMLHDAQQISEDMYVVWICSEMGDNECGPNSPAVSINLLNLLNW